MSLTDSLAHKVLGSHVVSDRLEQRSTGQRVDAQVETVDNSDDVCLELGTRLIVHVYPSKQFLRVWIFYKKSK